ncbi:MAG: hypothetical protein JWO15_1751 [Sphingomonadales bacterium]|nr:hypothetical protein [Sphingomonadales bacterium]
MCWTLDALFNGLTDGPRLLFKGGTSLPTPALDGMGPIEMLATPAGAQLVYKPLTRLDFGVYTLSWRVI